MIINKNIDGTVHSILMLCLDFIGMDCVIGELCYKGTILLRNYRKMIILWSFAYNAFIKFHGKLLGDPCTI